MQDVEHKLWLNSVFPGLRSERFLEELQRGFLFLELLEHFTELFGDVSRQCVVGPARLCEEFLRFLEVGFGHVVVAHLGLGASQVLVYFASHYFVLL